MGWGTATTQSWARSSAAALAPSWPPSGALAALQAPSCPQNTVAQPSLRPREDEDGPGRIKGTVRRGRPWHMAAPCPPCSPAGAAPRESETGRAELAAGHRSPQGSGRGRGRPTRGEEGREARPSLQHPARNLASPRGCVPPPAPSARRRGPGLGAHPGHPELAVFHGFGIWEGRNPLPTLLGMFLPGSPCLGGTRWHRAQGHGAAPHGDHCLPNPLPHVAAGKAAPQGPGGPVSPCWEG